MNRRRQRFYENFRVKGSEEADFATFTHPLAFFCGAEKTKNTFLFLFSAFHLPLCVPMQQGHAKQAGGMR